MFGTLNEVQKIVNDLQHSSGNRVNGQQVANQLLERQVYVEGILESSDGKSQQCIINDTMSEPIDAANHLYNINYGHDIKSNRPIIGKIIVFIRRVIRKVLFFLLNPIIEEQNRFNISVVQSLNEIHSNIISSLSQNNENRANIALIHERIEKNEKNIKELFQMLEESKDNLEETKNRLKEIKSELEQLKNSNNVLKIESQNRYNEMNEKIGVLQEAQMLLDVKIKKVIPKNDGKKTVLLSKKNIGREKSMTYNDIDYFSFENSFRGSTDSIKNAQKIYVDFYKGKNNILDMGCGRGEFLELLKENGISAIGVDLYDDFVELCKEKGLSAVCGDAIEYLATQKEDSLGGIFGAQIVEHLQPEQIMNICDLAYNKLEKDGCIILETPNPKCLSIYTNAFYIDPSHVKPVHPETMKYFLKQAGFRNIQIIFTESSRIPYKLPLLQGNNISNLEEFNSGINLLTELIFGSQDYAIIAKK